MRGWVAVICASPCVGERGSGVWAGGVAEAPLRSTGFDWHPFVRNTPQIKMNGIMFRKVTSWSSPQATNPVWRGGLKYTMVFELIILKSKSKP
jgi:hypothetical protein